MFLFPKKTKFNNFYTRKKINYSNRTILKSTIKKFALISYSSGKVNNKQLESFRKTSKRLLKSNGKHWIVSFPNLPVTKKTEGVRMGKGKGKLSFWVCNIPSGFIFAEFNGCSWPSIKKVVKQARTKLSVRVFLSVIRI